MRRVRLERTADSDFIAYRIVDDETREPLLAGLFVSVDAAGAYCRPRRWAVAEIVHQPPLAAVVTATAPEPPRRAQGLAKPRDDRTTAALDF